MALPTNITTETTGHAGIHNTANAEVNRIAALVDGAPTVAGSLDAVTGQGTYWVTSGSVPAQPYDGVPGILVVHKSANVTVQVFQSSDYGWTAQRIRVGAGAWGAWLYPSPSTAVEVFAGDLDTLVAGGIRVVSSGATHLPAGFTGGLLTVTRHHASGLVFQELLETTTGHRFSRARSGTWGAWTKVAATAV